MHFEQKVKEGIFLKRYKRFLADVQVGKEIITVHVPNTGSLKSCNKPGSECLFSEHFESGRKIPYTLEAIASEKTWVGVNTSWPNKLAEECFMQKTFPHWHKFDRYQAEVKISEDSRIDLVLWSAEDIPEIKKLKWADVPKAKNLHLVEVKNVTLKEGNCALFPDAVTERGQKHLLELMQFMDKGFTAEMLYIIQRDDCREFAPAENIDPTYAELLRKAQKKGLIITPLVVKVSPKGLEPRGVLPVRL